MRLSLSLLRRPRDEIVYKQVNFDTKRGQSEQLQRNGGKMVVADQNDLLLNYFDGWERNHH